MKKYLNLFLIAAPVILLAILTISMAVLRTSLPEVTLRISGYDPRDLLSGHYIAYTIDWGSTDCTQFENQRCPVPEFRQHGIYGTWGNNHRFYIPEKYAAELDRLFRNRNTDDNVFEVVYSYAKGFKPIAKRLLINGKDWRETVKNSQ